MNGAIICLVHSAHLERQISHLVIRLQVVVNRTNHMPTRDKNYRIKLMMLRLIMPKIHYIRASQILYRAINLKNILMHLNETFVKGNCRKSLGLMRHQFIVNIQTLQAQFKERGLFKKLLMH
ncbi:hypothetical protein D9M71_514490 [compost metagenome]